MANNTVIVHLGDYKTGSTALQSMFLQLAKLNKNIVYPDIGRLGHQRHLNLRHELNGDPRYQPDGGSWKDIHNLIATQHGKLIILSEEGFLKTPINRLIKELKRLRDSQNVSLQLIVYFRPHFGRMVATYAQKTKTGALNQTFAEFAGETVNYGRFCLGAPIGRLQSEFKDIFGVRLFNREQLYEGDICRDFAKIHGFDINKLPDGEAAQSNVSPGLAGLAVAQEIWRESGVEPTRANVQLLERRVIRHARDLCRLSGADNRPFRFPEIDEEIVASLKSMFLKDIEGAGFDAEMTKKFVSLCEIKMDASIRSNAPLFASLDEETRAHCRPIIRLASQAALLHKLPGGQDIA